VRHKFEVLDGYCRQYGRDPKAIKRTIQIPLFLSDNPSFKERVLQGMVAMRGGTPEEAAASILIGNADEVREQVGRFQKAGVEEMYLALWPRFVKKAVVQFSDEVIPAFA
jgi:alkanesulfonate monooxygenase SsuD/methylene tetrahydromethanopterin reductase-like flavin-dependent oxidoreductase (luciferase family)